MPMLVEYGDVRVVDETAADRQLAAIRWARRALRSPELVVLGVETRKRVSGSETRSIWGIALIDANGAERINTSLIPTQPPLLPQAGRTDRVAREMDTAVPSLRSILPLLLRATTSCVIATYNAPVVYELVMSELRANGMDPQHLQDPSNWRCVSQARSDWFGQPHHHFPLRTAEHALDRCHATLNILREIASSPPNPADHR